MGKFEESWKEVFKKAEVSPSDSVWATIDRGLAGADGKSMKKRVVVYQRIAAASLLFALLAGSFGVYRWSSTPSKLTLQKSIKDKPLEQGHQKLVGKGKSLLGSKSEKETVLAEAVPTDSPKENESASTTTNLAQRTVKNNFTFSNSIPGDSNKLKNKLTLAMNAQWDNSKTDKASEEKMASTQRSKKLHHQNNAIPGLDLLPIEKVQGEPVITVLVRKLTAIPGAFMNRMKDKTMQEKLWASVTASSGRFTSTASAYSNPAYSYAAGPQSSSSPNFPAVNGTSYSIGMLGGVRMTNRLVLQSGLLYINQSSGSLSNINPTNSLASVANYIKTPSPSTYGTTSPYRIISANEFVSVPVLLGYLFIDKKIGLQLNAGGATDVFIRNTLTDPNGRLQSYSQGAGQNSPYRSVDFAALVSSEVSYRFSGRYRISFVPGFRYSFNPVLRANTNSISNPWLWDVGFRLRYIIK